MVDLLGIEVVTADNIADFFTKPLGAKAFFAMRAVIMNEPGALAATAPPTVEAGSTGAP